MYETYKKESICRHIIKKNMDNIIDCYKDYVKNNEIYFNVKTSDIYKLTEEIKFNKPSKDCSYTFMNKYY